jgi:hypothetical protein
MKENYTKISYPGDVFVFENDSSIFPKSISGERNRTVVFLTFKRNCNEFQKFENRNIQLATFQKSMSIKC